MKRYFLNCLKLYLVTIALDWQLLFMLDWAGVLTDRLRETIGTCFSVVFLVTAVIYLIVFLVKKGYLSRLWAFIKETLKKAKNTAKRLPEEKAGQVMGCPAAPYPQKKISVALKIVIIVLPLSLTIQNGLVFAATFGRELLFSLKSIPVPILLIALLRTSVATAFIAALFYDGGAGKIVLYGIISGVVSVCLFGCALLFLCLVRGLSDWAALGYVFYILVISPFAAAAVTLFTMIQLVVYRLIVRKRNWSL